MNYFAGWYAIFVREMLLFRRKFFKFSFRCVNFFFEGDVFVDQFLHF